MNAMQNYKKIIEALFKQTIDIPNTKNTNNCIGALDKSVNFAVFKQNFTERLQRIITYYRDDAETTKDLINTVRAIALAKGYKWSGPYSELVALDYWIQYDCITDIKYVHRGKVDDFEDSIAKKIGQKEIDLDISFDLGSTKIFMDVKSLIPTHIELVDQILDNLKKRIRDTNYLISIDDLFDVDYLKTKKDYINELQYGTLIDELSKCIYSKNSYYEHILQSGNKAKFRIAYGKPGANTVLTTTRSMDPIKLAIDYKYKILDYYNKLLIYKPSFILFVANPWFNKEMNVFSDFNETFYRALSRCVFMELSKITDDMSIYYPELANKGLKISDIARLVSGIIFISDNSILQTGKKMNDVYIYTNPNAKNEYLTKSSFGELHLTHQAHQPTVIEDFSYGNN